MRDVYMIGAAQSDYGSFPSESYRSLFAEAFEGAVDRVDGDFDRERVDEAYIETLGVGGRQLGLPGSSVTEHVGLDGTPSTCVENACAASGVALRQAALAIRSGVADIVLAGGIEIMTDISGEQTRYWLGVSGETAWERMAGTTFSGVYAQMADAHMAEYGTTREHLSRVAVKNHANGAKNSHAHLGFECSLEDTMNGSTVADPLNLYDCCPTSDGASAVLLASEDAAEELTEKPIRLTGTGQASDRVGLFQRDTITGIPATSDAAEQAYGEASVGSDDIDFAEVHDCFSIAELMAYEDLGFCEKGDAGDYIASGATLPDGERPVTTGKFEAQPRVVDATPTPLSILSRCHSGQDPRG